MIYLAFALLTISVLFNFVLLAVSHRVLSDKITTVTTILGNLLDSQGENSTLFDDGPKPEKVEKKVVIAKRAFINRSTR